VIEKRKLTIVSFNDFFVEKVIKHNVSFPPDTGTETGDMTGDY